MAAQNLNLLKAIAEMETTLHYFSIFFFNMLMMLYPNSHSEHIADVADFSQRVLFVGY